MQYIAIFRHFSLFCGIFVVVRMRSDAFIKRGIKNKQRARATQSERARQLAVAVGGALWEGSRSGSGDRAKSGPTAIHFRFPAKIVIAFFGPGAF